MGDAPHPADPHGKKLGFRELLRLLDQGDEEERNDACFELGKTSDPRAIKPVLESLHSKRVSIGMATWAIGNIGHMRSVTALLHLARRKEYRSHAVKALIDLATSAVHPESARHLQWDPDRQAVCQAALACMVRLVEQTPEAILPLLKAIEEPGTRMQCEGAVGILLKMDKAAVSALLPLLRNDERSVQKLAALALSAINWIPTNSIDGAVFWTARSNWQACRAMTSMAVEPLLSALQDTEINAKDRKEIIEALGHLGDERALPALLALMKDREVRESAVEALGRLGDGSAVPVLRSLLKGGATQDEEFAALLSLVRLGDAGAVEELPRFLSRCHWYVRNGAEKALVKDGAAIIRALRSMLLTKDTAIVILAARCLGKLRDRESVDPLISLLSYGDSSVVENAAYALGQIRDPYALNTLIHLVKVAADPVASENLFADFRPIHESFEPHSPQSIAGWALGELGEVTAAEHIVAAWEKAPSFARSALIVALAKLDPQKAANLLGFGSGGKPVRETVVIRELWRLGAVAVEPLAEALRHSLRRDVLDKVSFEDVVFSLGRTREDAAIGPLVLSLQKCDKFQRGSILAALVDIGPQVVPELLKQFGKNDNDMKERAIRALGEINTKAPLDPIQRAGAVEELTSFGFREDPSLMLVAVQTLRSIRDRRAIPFLIDILSGRDASVEDRKILHLALRRSGLTPTEFLYYDRNEQMKDDVIRRARLEAAYSLAEFGHPDAAAPLIVALEQQEPEVRQRAAAALAHCLGNNPIRSLVARILDWHPGVRRAAADSLGSLRHPESLAALRGALTDQSHEVRHAAAAALSNLGWRPGTRREEAEFAIATEDWNRCAGIGSAAVGPLSARLADATPFIRKAAIEALAACRGSKAMDALRNLLRNNGRQDMRIAAIEAIAHRRRIELGPDIAECLRNEENSNLVAAAIRGLDHLKVQPAHDLLAALLQNSNSEVAAAAASMLGYSRDPGATTLLIAALEKRSDVVKQAAIRSLGRLKSQEAVGTLVSRLNDEQAGGEVRALATEALGRIGGPAAFEALLVTLEDPTLELRAAAGHALEACANETTLGSFVWKLHMERDVGNTHFTIRSALAKFAEVAFIEAGENGETDLGKMVREAAKRRLREGSRDAALACYTNVLRFYTDSIDTLGDDAEDGACDRAVEFAFALVRDGIDLFAENEDAHAAGEIARCAIELARAAGNYKKLWNALHTICVALTQVGDDRLTLEIHERAIQLIESMWFFYPTEEVQFRAFFSDKAALYDGLALCYQRLGATAQAWEIVEAAKARYLSDLIVRRRASPVETYSQVEEVLWSSVRRASAAAGGPNSDVPSGKRQLVGIEPAGGAQDAWILEPQSRKAFMDFLRANDGAGWPMTFIADLWDAAAEWVGDPLGPKVQEAFRPLRSCIHDVLQRRSGGPQMPPVQFREMIEKSREALDEIALMGKIRVPIGAIADYFPGLNDFAEARPPYRPEQTLELEALLEVLNLICGEGEVFVTTRARTPNDPPAKWSGVFQKPGGSQPRRRRVHEASQKLEAACHGLSETSWRYVTRVARGEPSSFARLRAMLEYESAQAIVALHVTAQGTVAYLFRGVLRDHDRQGLPDSSRVHSSDMLTFPASTLDRIQKLVKIGWLDPLHKLELQTGNERIEGPARDRMSETLGQLYTDLLGPIVRRLRRWGVRRITFIPSRGLYVLPLHASWHESRGQRRYLADDYEISYAPSFTLLEICRARSESRMSLPPRLYAWAGSSSDLPFARTEVARVARLFPKPAEVPMAADRAGKLRADMATHIHFACHGDYNWDDPLESGLQIGDDHRLRLADLFDDAFPLKNASLVVLSACQTGVADPNDLADECLGLTAGFLFAGAPAVVSTLWPVNDLATMLLMEQLYRHQLNQQRGPAAALRHAQVWLRKATAASVCNRLTSELKKLPSSEKRSLQEEIMRNAHVSFSEMEPGRKPFEDPYYWAAFTLNGVFQTN